MKHPFISDDELSSALVQVRDMFVHQLIDNADSDLWGGDAVGRGFNINATCNGSECGTVACIGGWAWLLARAKPLPAHPSAYDPCDLARAAEFVRATDCTSGYVDIELHRLFYPPTESWLWITTSHAVQAIDNYLATGNADWARIEAEYLNRRKAA